MYPTKGPQAPPRSGFAQSMDGIANVLAIVATFFIAPMLFQISIGWVCEFAAAQYGAQFIGLASALYGFVCAAIIYWLVRGVTTEFLLKRGINNLIR